MARTSFPVWSLFLLLSSLVSHTPTLLANHDKTSVYIFYMGETKHDSPNMTEETHHTMLASVLGSKDAASNSMIYSYKHGFSGFAAKLTEDQAQKIQGHSDVVKMVPNHKFKLHTTRSWDYLGLPLHTSSNNLLAQSKMGEDAIIGIIDSGIWPESDSFSDKGLGPIPSRWKGICEAGQLFNSSHCNRKIIGARYYVKGLFAELGDQPINSTVFPEYLSPRGAEGHGTHTASTAGGAPVDGANQYGLGSGVARGGAPAARVASYKACWLYSGGECTSADILKAFDDAIHDGVDVLSVSLGKDKIPEYPETDPLNGMTIGAFHAVVRGIPVAFSGGNEGPDAGTILNTAPWVITVAASSIDRAFPVEITLSDNTTILGQGMSTKTINGPKQLKVYSGKGTAVETGGVCSDLPLEDPTMEGNVVFCVGDVSTTPLLVALKNKAAALIISTDFKNQVANYDIFVPTIFVDYTTGAKLFRYFYTSRSPTVKIAAPKTWVGKPLPTTIPAFSNRGPNGVAPEILKPDIAAPGVHILAAVPPPESAQGALIIKDGTYEFQSGTSMACPHVGGIIALLRSIHPNWSPAAIRSALVTTASQTDPYGEPIFAVSGTVKVADPFDFGGGLVDPNKAAHPGLVYDMGVEDYIHYICSMGDDEAKISILTSKVVSCPTKKPSRLDLNLPSITIPNLRDTITVTRTVTNVGTVNSIYHASIVAPQGVTVSVSPNILYFNSSARTQSFKVTFTTSHSVQGGYYFGSLTWSDEYHVVRIPISVKTEFLKYFSNFT